MPPPRWSSTSMKANSAGSGVQRPPARQGSDSFIADTFLALSALPAPQDNGNAASIAPVEAATENLYNSQQDPKKRVEGSPTVNSSDVPFVLPPNFPVDRMSVAVSNGIPVLLRSPSERQDNPERLKLDNLSLSMCPILEHEYHLRLLTLQHNRIRKIEHLSNLKNLIFLDMYGNNIMEISGLESVSNLRVLMLGQNQIDEISRSALAYVPHLDVLDLHSNNIREMANLDALTQLRVLNLSQNHITQVNNISGLQNLTELNLSKNNISLIGTNFGDLRFLERLNLSDNDIDAFEKAAPILKLSTLQELSFSRNPMCTLPFYRETWIESMRGVRHFDGKRVSEEERRVAGINLRREDDKRRGAQRAAAAKAEREDDINKIQQQWQTAMSGNKEVALNCLAETDGDCLHIYGNPQEAIERCLLDKIRNRFSTLSQLILQDTDIATFKHIAAISVLRKVEHLVIHEAQPLCRNLSLWKKYALFRLWQLPLESVNGEEVTEEQRAASRQCFNRIGKLITHHEKSITKRWESLEDQSQLQSTDSKKKSSSSDSKWSGDGTGRKSQAKHRDRNIPQKELECFSQTVMQELIEQASLLIVRQNQMKKVWDQCVTDIIDEALTSYDDEVRLPENL